MRATRSAAIMRTSLLIIAGIGAMRGGPGGAIVIGMPKIPLVINRAILIGVVKIDIQHMTREGIGDPPPARVTGACELSKGALDDIILIIIMGNDGRCIVAGWLLVVGPQFPPISPAIFIDDLTTRGESFSVINRGIEEVLIDWRVSRSRRWPCVEEITFGVPIGWENRHARFVSRFQAL